jgi:hypothetical protein
MNPRAELDRRLWMRAATLGAVGGTLTTPARGDGPQPDDDEEARKRFLRGPGCPQILKVSKRLAGRLSLYPGEPCKCECRIGDKVQVVFRVNYRAILKFHSVAPCDETATEPLLQDGSTELWLSGALTLRLEKCREAETPVLLGCNTGTYTIHRYRPNEDIMTGPFCGTEGFMPTEKEGRRCCAPGHGVGSFCGEGVNKLKGWSLCASYHSLVKGLNPDKLCERTETEMVIDLDGALVGPCEPMRKAEPKP